LHLPLAHLAFDSRGGAITLLQNNGSFRSLLDPDEWKFPRKMLNILVVACPPPTFESKVYKTLVSTIMKATTDCCKVERFQTRKNKSKHESLEHRLLRGVQCDIFHLDSHTTNDLTPHLDAKLGNSARLSWWNRLFQSLHSQRKVPDVVVLSSCESIHLGEVLTKYVPFVIVTRMPITHSCVLPFASTLYSQLSAGYSLYHAFSHARETAIQCTREQIRMQEADDDALFKRGKRFHISSFGSKEERGALSYTLLCPFELILYKKYDFASCNSTSFVSKVDCNVMIFSHVPSECVDFWRRIESAAELMDVTILNSDLLSRLSPDEFEGLCNARTLLAVLNGHYGRYKVLFTTFISFCFVFLFLFWVTNGESMHHLLLRADFFALFVPWSGFALFERRKVCVASFFYQITPKLGFLSFIAFTMAYIAIILPRVALLLKSNLICLLVLCYCWALTFFNIFYFTLDKETSQEKDRCHLMTRWCFSNFIYLLIGPFVALLYVSWLIQFGGSSLT
jgi:hypothetical protein